MAVSLVTYLLAAAAAVAAQEAAPAAPSIPGPRIAHTLALHPPSGLVVLFGGQRPDGTPLGDTWGWDGASWTRLAEGGPPARRWPALAFDTVRQRLVLFGGRDGRGRDGTSLGDCWEWDGASWMPAEGGPPGRDHHTLVFDAVRRQLVLFGGWDGTGVRGDTWIRDARQKWYRRDGDGPPPRAAHGAAFDANAGTVLLHGGRALDVFLDDTWTWDGQGWTKANVSGPGRRSFHGMAWDEARRRIVLVGGREGPTRFGDTWTWRDGRWSLLTKSGPSPRLVYALAPTGQGAVVLHGGGHQDEESQTWVLDDATWILEGAEWRRAP